jgi:hypothetical protein
VKWVDVPLLESSTGPAILTLEPDGMHVVFDLDAIHPACRGEMRIDFRTEIPDADLARLQVRRVAFSVEAQKVVRLWGSMSKLPTDGDHA